MNGERKPLLALGSALLMPGLGQVYNGDLSRGLSFFLFLAFVLPIFAWLGLHGPEKLLWLVTLSGAGIAFAAYVYATRDAYLKAKQTGAHYALKPFNRGYVYAALLFFGYFFVFSQLTGYAKDQLLEAYQVPSISMVPSLLRGDHFFVDKRINRPGAESVRRGDIAIFINPNDRSLMYVKRVIGLPGDQIDIAGTSVSVNGKALAAEPVTALGSPELDQLLSDHMALRETSDAGAYYVIWKKSEQHPTLSFRVPNGDVFMLGDNRDESRDSRFIGPVPLVDVVGKAKQVWFSLDAGVGIRWSRIGHLLDAGV